MFEAQIRRLLHRSPYQWNETVKRRFFNKNRLKAFDPEHPCVFVLSTGRAGTKTLAALLGLASNVLAYHEPIPRLVGLSALAYRYASEDLAHDILSEAFKTTRLNLFNYSLSCGKGYVETGPCPTFLAPILLQAVPEVKFVHLVRDPRDVIRSGMRRSWYAGHLEDNTRIVPLPDTDDGKRWDSYSTLQKVAWLWAETNRWIRDFCDTLPPDRKLFIRAEDVFVSDPGTMTKLFGFVNASLPPDHKISKVLEMKLNEQKAGTDSVPDFQANGLDKMARFVGDISNHFGYDIG